MTRLASSTSSSLSSKPHYALLDGLRGVAALLVLGYHVGEAFATSPADQCLNHGYLAVDFFFMLSGFVISYAYDDRWHTHLSLGNFLKRRLFRLHPMVVMGALLGLVSFCLQGCTRWDGTHVAAGAVALAAVLHMLLLPTPPSALPEVRGNGEMYPLNGPSWSLFYEYIGNLVYALVLRRLSRRALSAFVVLMGLGLAGVALSNASGFWHLGLGWRLDGANIAGGSLRLFFAFSMGLLLRHTFRPLPLKGSFWWCTALLVVFFSLPYMGIKGHEWTNGLYEIFCVFVLFPLIVIIGASGSHGETTTTGRICKFVGDLSYPLYITHYPLMYLFYSWKWSAHYTAEWAAPAIVLLLVSNVLIAWLCMQLYDIPVRRWLTRRFLTH